MSELILTPIDDSRKGKFYHDMSDSDSWWWIEGHLDEAKKELFEGIHRDEYGWDVSYRQTNELLDKLVQWFGDDSDE